jgi:hypothetical protein
LKWPCSGISDFSGSVGAWRRSCHTDPELLQTLEKDLRGFEIGRLEPFGEPVVDRLEELQRLRGTALIVYHPSEARRGAQLPGQGTLPARPVERLPEIVFGSGCLWGRIL